MKFTGFKVVPAICIDFSDEGRLYYSIAEDQDAELLKRAFEKAESGLDALPEDLQLVWSELEIGSVAVREVGDERDETPVSGDFFGSGSIIDATYELDGRTHTFDLISGDADDRIEQICASLNALLRPARVVVDITGGAIHGVDSDRPAQILFVSNDSDDVQDFDDACLVPPSENMDDPHAWWLREAELDDGLVNHYWQQVNAEAALTPVETNADLRAQCGGMQMEIDELREALTKCVASLDQLLPYLAKVPADVGLLNDALMAARPLLEKRT